MSLGGVTATVIEEKNPLKQGLKLGVEVGNRIEMKIEEKNPVKQGLKPLQSGILPGSIIPER